MSARPNGGLGVSLFQPAPRTGFDEITYAFEMLGGGMPKFYRRMPDGRWEEYAENVVHGCGERFCRFSFWNAEGVNATRIVLAMHSDLWSVAYPCEVVGYAIAHRLGMRPVGPVDGER